MSKYMQKNYHTCNRTSMHISVFLWNLQRLHSLAHIMPQLLKRFLELCKNYFLGQFTSFTRKSVLLLYNYTFFFLKSYYPAWSPTWFTTLGSKLTWLFPKFKCSQKMKICHCWKCALGSEGNFRRGVQKCVWLLTRCLPAGSNPPHSHKHLQDPASVRLPITASGVAKLFEKHVCI